MTVVRVPWASASFLLYAGGAVLVVATGWLLAELANDSGKGGFTGWALLALLVAASCAFAFREARRPVAAGLLAVVMVVAFAVFVGALLDWVGWLPDDADSPFGGFRWGLILLELLTLAFALWALGVFRFPLLVLAAAGVGWFSFTDVVSGGGDWSAIVTVFFGLCLLAAALAVDPFYAFWLHVVAGLTIGGGLLWFWNSSDLDWILVALVALAYVWLGGALERSSWVVLGALGLLLSASHFIDKWFGLDDLDPFGFFFGLDGDASQSEHGWASPFAYVVLGFVYFLLAFALERRRRALPPPGPELAAPATT